MKEKEKAEYDGVYQRKDTDHDIAVTVNCCESLSTFVKAINAATLIKNSAHKSYGLHDLITPNYFSKVTVLVRISVDELVKL